MGLLVIPFSCFAEPQLCRSVRLKSRVHRRHLTRIKIFAPNIYRRKGHRKLTRYRRIAWLRSYFLLWTPLKTCICVRRKPVSWGWCREMLPACARGIIDACQSFFWHVSLVCFEAQRVFLARDLRSRTAAENRHLLWNEGASEFFIYKQVLINIKSGSSKHAFILYIYCLSAFCEQDARSNQLAAFSGKGNIMIRLWQSYHLSLFKFRPVGPCIARPVVLIFSSGPEGLINDLLSTKLVLTRSRNWEAMKRAG